ncbi:MAG: hemolysin III family protein [Clostridia bacterium]|nr:hemolysin III family protein [Clostridia bacterium]
MAKVRDLVSGLTHCIAAGLSLIGLVILIVFASIWGNAYHIVSFTIFGSSLFLLYLFSTLYHWLNIGEKGLSVFRKFDHIMIYIFIAASYTPVCLTALRGAWGWSIFGVQWGLALLGTIFTAIWIKAPRWVTTSIYIAMGWTVIIAIYPLIQSFKALNLINALWWLLAGGIFYTIGGLIYGFKWPKINLKHFGFHEIFHIFVMLGSACHYWFILYYLLQIP